MQNRTATLPSRGHAPQRNGVGASGFRCPGHMALGLQDSEGVPHAQGPAKLGLLAPRLQAASRPPSASPAALTGLYVPANGSRAPSGPRAQNGFRAPSGPVWVQSAEWAQSTEWSWSAEAL